MEECILSQIILKTALCHIPAHLQFSQGFHSSCSRKKCIQINVFHFISLWKTFCGQHIYPKYSNRCHTHFQFSANQTSWSRFLIQIHILNAKQCRSRSIHKPSDLDLHCLQRQGISGFSRTRVKNCWVILSGSTLFSQACLSKCLG